MKNKIASVIVVAMTICLILSACTATPASNNNAGDNNNPGVSDTTGDTQTNTVSSYDQLMSYLNNPETSLPLSGVQPKEYDSRANVNKALPVAPKAAGDIKIGWAMASLGSEYFIGVRDSGLEYSKQLGMKAPDLENADFNLETQQQQVDTYITNKVDVLILNAVDLHSSVQMIQKVVDAGIPVIVTGPTPAESAYEILTAVVPGSNESGFQVGEYCAQQLYKPGSVLNVGMIISKLEDADSNSRPCGWIAGYLYQSAQMNGTPYASKYDALLEAYNVWQVYKNDRKYDLSAKGLMLSQLGVGEGTDAAKGQAAAADILVAEPDMDLLMVEMDSMAIGALAEIKTQGKTPGKDIKVATCADATLTSLNYIKSGELMATATNIPYLYSALMFNMIYNMFDGTGTDKTQAEWCSYYNDMPASVYVPTMAITADNIDKYYPPDTNDPIFGQFATFDPWTPMDIPSYNTAHAND